jgi:NAD(P)-dependent dehydrogenase (short-subunit alcohol dehydrogenase family)
MNIPPDEVEICLKVLQQISEEPSLIDSHDRFKSLIAKIYKNGRKESRRALQQQQKEETQKLKAMTAMVQRQLQEQPVATLPDSIATQNELVKPIHCYICKQPYTAIHFFYHRLCPTCAELNYSKRHQRTDLTNRVALVTGGRIKIGYQIALRMLRDGARVIVTTRFPRDCARRFSLEPDFAQWRSHLQIHGLDLRHIGNVEAFVSYLLNAESALDIIINNAAQTIKRPLEFYQHLLSEENNPQEIISSEANSLITSKTNSILLETQPQYPGHLLTNNVYFPENTFDADGQQLDTRPVNSWRLKLDEVSTVEMLEVNLVNAIAPFILNSQLKPLLIKSPFHQRFIINVSAMEGQFNRVYKSKDHPHTNMAKAALNMMTRTSASDYARDGIFMNSVDTGWITDENPYVKKVSLQQQGFYTPLDIIDGMARIYDPIVQGIENPEEPLYGHFLKDYAPNAW